MKLTSTLLVLFSIMGVVYGKLFPQIALGGTEQEFEYRLRVQLSSVGGHYTGDIVLLPTIHNKEIWPGDWYVDGESRTDTTYYTVRDIPKNGTRILTITGGAEVQIGALLVHGHSEDDNWKRNSEVAVTVTYQIFRRGHLIDTVGVPYNAFHATDMRNVIVIPVSKRKGEHNTGFAYVLMGGAYQSTRGYYNDVLVELYDDEGRRLGGVRYRHNSSEGEVDHFHKAIFIDEAFGRHTDTDLDFKAVLEDEFVGTIRIHSRYGTTLSGMGLRLDWLSDGSIQYTSLPITVDRK